MEKEKFEIKEPPKEVPPEKQETKERGGFVGGQYVTKRELKEAKEKQEDPHHRWEQP